MKNLRRPFLTLIALCATLFCCTSLVGKVSANSRSMIEYKVTTNVTYGKGTVTVEGKEVSRDLWMDVYEPLEKARNLRPAVIMTFGGSLHRGGPRHTFHEGGAQDTSMGDYCRRFAARGYVCFAIDYRLAPEGPKPERKAYTNDDLDMKSFNNPLFVDHVNKIRRIMGLEPIDPKDTTIIVNTVLAAAEDLRKAIAHVQESSERYNIDPTKVAIGGFSAGAVTTLNVAYGMHAPVAAVFTLSGGICGFDIPKGLAASPRNPPILMFQGQYDLEGILLSTPVLLKHFDEIGLEHTLAWVPGLGHFYTCGTMSLSGDGTRLSVEERIAQFLDKTIGSAN